MLSIWLLLQTSLESNTLTHVSVNPIFKVSSKNSLTLGGHVTSRRRCRQVAGQL